MKTLVSIVTPAYREQENLAVFHKRLMETMEGTDLNWEWVIVDDHSSDDTYKTIQEICAKDSRVRGFRLAHNYGSDRAINCGLNQ